jgi:hypothetical protein
VDEHAERILDAGRAIRPYLDDLVPDRAGELDAELAAALLDDDAEATEARVLDLLTRDPTTAAWTVAFVAEGRPASAEIRSGYQPLPGHGSPTPAARFRCPFGDYLWYRRSAGLPVPLCPTHRAPLELDDR